MENESIKEVEGERKNGQVVVVAKTDGQSPNGNGDSTLFSEKIQDVNNPVIFPADEINKFSVSENAGEAAASALVGNELTEPEDSDRPKDFDPLTISSVGMNKMTTILGEECEDFKPLIGNLEGTTEEKQGKQCGEDGKNCNFDDAESSTEDQQAKQCAENDAGASVAGKSYTEESREGIQLATSPSADSTSKTEDAVISTDVSVSSRGVESTSREEVDSWPQKLFFKRDGWLFKDRHPDCRYSWDEATRVSQKLKNRCHQKCFLYRVYYDGAHPDRIMKYLLLGPRINSPKERISEEAVQMFQVLPNRSLYCRAKRMVKAGENPASVVKQFLLRPEVQEQILVQRLKLSGSKDLLCEVLEGPVSPDLLSSGEETNAAETNARQEESVSCDEPGTSNRVGNSSLVSTETVTPSEALKPKKSNSMAVKDWFNHFLQGGMSADDAFEKVRELLLQSGHLENTIQDCFDPCYANPVGGPTSKASDVGESKTELTGSSKPRKKKKAMWFRQIVQCRKQLKLYNRARFDGLAHERAITKVVTKFYLDPKPDKKSFMSSKSGQEDRFVSGVSKNGGKRFSNADERSGFDQSGLRAAQRNVSDWSGQRFASPQNLSARPGPVGASMLPRNTAPSRPRGASLSCQGWGNEPQALPRPEPSPYNQSSLGRIALPQHGQDVRNLDRFSTPYSPVELHSRTGPTAGPAPDFSRQKRVNAFEERHVRLRPDVRGPNRMRSRSPPQASRESFHNTHLASTPFGYPDEYSSTSRKRQNLCERDPKRIRFEEPSRMPTLHPAETQFHCQPGPSRSNSSSGNQPLPVNAAGKQKCAEGTVPLSDPLHVCIVPVEYPRKRLSDDQIDAIENMIVEATLEIDNDIMKPLFNGSSRTNGRYEVICQDQYAKHWLEKYVAWFEPWPHASLKLMPVEETKLRVDILLPLCKNDNVDKIMKFIAKQNSDYNVGGWEVVGRQDGVNTSLSLLVDEESAEKLKSSGKIHFKLGQADVVFVEDRRAAEGERSAENPYLEQSRSDRQRSDAPSGIPSGASRGARLDNFASSSRSISQNPFIESPRSQQQSGKSYQRSIFCEPSPHSSCDDREGTRRGRCPSPEQERLSVAGVRTNQFGSGRSSRAFPGGQEHARRPAAETPHHARIQQAGGSQPQTRPSDPASRYRLSHTVSGDQAWRPTAENTRLARTQRVDSLSQPVQQASDRLLRDPQRQSFGPPPRRWR